MSQEPLFSILLDDPSELAVKISQVGKILAQCTGEPLPDATQRVRYSGGVLARKLEESLARKITRGLASAGLGSFLVAQGELAVLPRPSRVGQLGILAEGLTLAPFLSRDEPASLPWGELLAVHAHATLEHCSPGDEWELPRRGGGAQGLSAPTKRLVERLRRFEEEERVLVSLGIDLLLEGPRFYRLNYDDTGVYKALEPQADPQDEIVELSFDDLGGFVLSPGSGSGPVWESYKGSYVLWEGVVGELQPAEGGLLVRPQPKSAEGAWLELREPRELAWRLLTPGRGVSYRARLVSCDPEKQEFRLDDGQLQLADNTHENFFILLRKLLALAPAGVYVPLGTRRFAAQGELTDILYSKREELDSVNTWILQARRQGLAGGEPEEVSDEQLEEETPSADCEEEPEDLDDTELLDDTESLDDSNDAEGGSARTSLSDLEGAMEHIAGKSTRMDMSDLRDLVEAAESLESAIGDLSSEEEDPELKEAMAFFDSRKSGKWEMKEVLAGQDDLGEEDLELEDTPG